ncbi:NRPS-like enzyme, putative [Cordyceps militaris CM01]|uniref:NRPS-like enzyme, putative n=1 Tax=Cordyceps militaris (strain CM01) TaxID=983644 RepID=G3JD25_CORMM|nr:NRPS-like enzyme, putative [Cordyceps militaris CM01]EGX93351.1 NRPS-like enzyme, putative [Cordyceps militaris CM01]
MAAAETANLPRTKLPFYDITFRNLEDGHYEPPSDYNQVSRPLARVVRSNDALLRAFGTFVLAVSDLEDAAFIADVGAERLLVTAKGPGINEQRRSFSSDNITISSVPRTSTVADGLLDFEIQVMRSGSGAKVPKQLSSTLVLAVCPTEEGNVADLQLFVDVRNGHAESTSHLLELAARYLAPEPAADAPSLQQAAPLSCRQNGPPTMISRPPLLKSDLRLYTSEADCPALLHSAFERRAAEAPDNSCVEYIADAAGEIEKWTFGEVHALADRLMEELHILEANLAWNKPFNGQRIVPLYLPGCPQLYAGYMGIMKAGCAFCPLPLDAPPERVQVILEDIEAPVVLGLGSNPFPGLAMETAEPHVAEFLGNITWVDMANLSVWRADRPAASLAPTQPRVPKEEDLAYILYTSGSTGKPKGVLISHKSGCCAIGGHDEAFPHLAVGPALRWLQFAMPTFDLSLIEIFVTMGNAGTLCVAERSLMLTDIERTIKRFDANTIFTVPSLATLLRPAKVPSLTTLVVGGELLNRYTIDSFSHDAPRGPGEPRRHLINIYGPTEATMAVATEASAVTTRGSVIGNCLRCAGIIIVDPNSDELVETPSPLTGELAIIGPQVGFGYLNRPKETSAAFKDGSHLGLGPVYKTGDRSRIVWTADGKPKVEILGRLSMEQVKLNGRRVELSEIESSIAKSELVREVAAVVLGKAQLVAYVSLADTSDSAEARAAAITDCRDVANRTMPTWMRPGDYTVLAELPRTASGKVDRKLLQKRAQDTFGVLAPVPASEAPAVAVDLASEDSVRALLVQTISSVIGETAASNDATTPLYTWGIDSLQGMRVLQSLREHGIEGLALNDIMVGNSLGALAKRVVELHHAVADPDADIDDSPIKIEDEEELLFLPLAAKLKHFEAECRPQCAKGLDIPVDEIEHVLPSTGMQTRMVAFFQECADEIGLTKPYVEHFPYKVPTDLFDLDRFEAAVLGVLGAHDAFRTVTCPVEHPLTPFAQVVLRQTSPRAALPVVRITCSVYDERPGSLWTKTIEQAQKSAYEVLHLDRPGAVVTFVYDEARAHCVMVWSLFHMIYDGISLEVLRREIARAYADPASVAGIAAKCPQGVRLPIEAHYSGDWLETSLYWMRERAGAGWFKLGPRALPVGGGEYSESFRNGDVACETLVSSLSLDDLNELTRRRGLHSSLAVTQAAYSMALAQTVVRLGDADDVEVQFATVLHGRQTPASLDCVALMLETLPAYINYKGVGPKMTHRDVVRHMLAEHVEQMPHAQMPCTTVDFARTGRRLDSSIILQAYPKPPTATATAAAAVDDLPGFNREENLMVPWQETFTGYPLLMELWQGFDRADEKLRIRCSYVPTWPGYEFMSKAWAQGLSAALEASLVRILGDPDAEFDRVALVKADADVGGGVPAEPMDVSA